MAVFLRRFFAGLYLQYWNANLLQHGAAMNEARAAREMEALDPFRNQELAVVAHACGIRHFPFPAKIIGGKLMADNKAFVVLMVFSGLICRVVLS
ncbi:hypothetical protein LQT79_26110 (plasmid) [Escherichia coli]|nr:hypothetical protein LQT79_26110 [Escherichia coli]